MARDVMTLRLERTTRLRLQAAAMRRRLTPSAAARTALEDWLRAEERREEARPYDAMGDLLGVVRGGDRGRSTRGSKGITGALGSRPRRRRR